MKEELLKLAERVEALSGPDREVDSEIDRLTFRGPFEDRLCGCMGNCLPGHPAYDGACVSVPHYTASLDAAMTLVPDVFSGQIWLRFNEGERNKPHAAIWSHDDGNGKPSRVNVEAKASTPALALCVAALRALAKEDS